MGVWLDIVGDRLLIAELHKFIEIETRFYLVSIQAMI
jgi:hypothetical protein